MVEHKSQMQALTFQPPGGIEALSYTTTFPTPTSDQLKPGEVLIKIVGAGLISAEITWETHESKDGVYPAIVLCPDYSGTVQAVAEDVLEFKPGDEVMAVSVDFDMEKGPKKLQGGAADYAIAPASWVTRKPQNVSLRDAASIPLCAFTAWQSFHDQASGQVKPGAEVLILGAGGATGLWAVQVAKLMGARVTVTASDPDGIKLLQQLGADEVINYKKESLEAKGRKFDLVLDAVGGKSFDQGTKVVKLASDGGLLISIVEYLAQDQAPEGVQAKFFIWRPFREQMAEIVGLIESGKLKPIIDSYFPLSQGIEAFKYASKGHCHGKVILEPQKKA